ncbi:unnamed protein product [Moneuplotes crassus]|uniref:Uncharacterized protein n=1 Tax=Euplotes crassus TaxID=5936 RepID=A0AAD1X941_EUPCR|nr:unnamed protein product [Moneuplotes crassus]
MSKLELYKRYLRTLNNFCHTVNIHKLLYLTEADCRNIHRNSDFRKLGSSNLQERCANQNIKAKFKNALFITSNASLPYSSVEKEAQRSLERDCINQKWKKLKSNDPFHKIRKQDLYERLTNPKRDFSFHKKDTSSILLEKYQDKKKEMSNRRHKERVSKELHQKIFAPNNQREKTSTKPSYQKQGVHKNFKIFAKKKANEKNLKSYDHTKLYKRLTNQTRNYDVKTTMLQSLNNDTTKGSTKVIIKKFGDSRRQSFRKPLTGTRKLDTHNYSIICSIYHKNSTERLKESRAKQIFERISSIAPKTSIKGLAKSSFSHFIEEGSSLPAPSILKYSRNNAKDIRPPKEKNQRYNSTGRNECANPLTKLLIQYDLSSSRIEKSQRLSSNSIIRGSEHKYIPSSKRLESRKSVSTNRSHLLCEFSLNRSRY